MELPEIPPGERTPLVEALLGIIRQLLDRVHELEVTNQELRDEIARLKGQKPRPDIKPSVLETPPSSEGPKKQRRDPAKRPKTSELHIDREVPLHPDNLPAGATFKAFEPYVVQDLLIKSDTTRYLRTCPL